MGAINHCCSNVIYPLVSEITSALTSIEEVDRGDNPYLQSEVTTNSNTLTKNASFVKNSETADGVGEMIVIYILFS